jgi:ABC-type Fe3+-hydroxamate transport system substrate-binding protein
MKHFHDQTGKVISIPSPPARIISLVPSQTELLYTLGLDDEVIGITKFCVHPNHWFRSKQKVGGTKQLKIDLIKTLQPDLVIANKEENVKEQVEAIEQFCPIWVSDVQNMQDAYEMMLGIGEITGKKREAEALVQKITTAFQCRSFQPVKRAAYFIWQKPYMVAGGDTFIHQMMQQSGFENVFAGRERYPEVSIDEVKHTGCELVLLSSEPFPFQQKHAGELQQQLPGVSVMLVDGEMFSWYGSRMLDALAYFAKIRETLFLAHEPD